MLFKNKKEKPKYNFEKILNAFSKYKKDYSITYEQNGADISVKIESLIKPSKPPKRAPTSLETSKTKA